MKLLLIVLLLLLSPPSYAERLPTIEEYTATGYAPLDPQAKRGMCFAGDPNITASGRRTEPGVTVAVPKNIPFGTWLYIEGVGWRRADDRGGRIKGKRLDICFQTRKKALRWGVRKVKVIIVWK